MNKHLLTIALSSAFLFVTSTVNASIIYIGDSGQNIYSLETTTLNATLLGKTEAQLTDLAVDTHGNLWGSSFSSLYSISGSAADTKVGDFGWSGMNALTFGADNTLYGAGNSSTNLFSINTGNGQATVTGNTGFRSSGDLEFDNSGTLYLAANTGSLDSLYNADTGSLIGSFGINNAYGLAFTNDTMYGFSGQSIFTVNTSTGAISDMGTISGMASGTQIWGAASNNAPVPEPATMLLFGTGLAGIFSRRIFRKKN